MQRTTKRILVVVAVVVAVAVFLGAIVFERLDRRQAATDNGRIAAVGDSITFGDGVGTSEREALSYPGQLETMLGAGHQVLNYGYIGATLLDTGDTPYKETDAYAASLESDPSNVLLMLGTNDSKPQNWDSAAYERQLEELVTLYRLLPSQPTVFLLTPPAAYENGAQISPDVIEDEIVPIIREVGEKTGAPVVDVHAATKGNPEYLPDGIHPNREGAAVIAATVRDAMRP